VDKPGNIVSINPLAMFPEGGQTRKHYFLVMFLKGGQTWKHCFLAKFPKVDKPGNIVS
jgi:hypothetical protein